LKHNEIRLFREIQKRQIESFLVLRFQLRFYHMLLFYTYRKLSKIWSRIEYLIPTYNILILFMLTVGELTALTCFTCVMINRYWLIFGPPIGLQ